MIFYHLSDLHLHDNAIDRTHHNGGHDFDVLNALTADVLPIFCTNY